MVTNTSKDLKLNLKLNSHLRFSMDGTRKNVMESKKFTHDKQNQQCVFLLLCRFCFFIGYIVFRCLLCTQKTVLSGLPCHFFYKKKYKCFIACKRVLLQWTQACPLQLLLISTGLNHLDTNKISVLYTYLI